MARVFSGIQPTGVIHIGNYLGTIKNWVQLQKEHECFFCVVDLHSLTVPKINRVMINDCLDSVSGLIACGVNSENIFVQSHVSEHLELFWYLSAFTQDGWLDRMTQYKNKSRDLGMSVNLGLYAYPVLQAADILLYDTEIVPIGEDQKQHVELTRDVAAAFNVYFGSEMFVLPEAQLRDECRVMSLRDGSKKMSKSDPSEYAAINIIDDDEMIRRKIMKAKTDSESHLLKYDERCEIKNLLQIFSGFSESDIGEISLQYTSMKDFKIDLADLICKEIAIIREKFLEIRQDRALLARVMRTGQERASEIAKKKLLSVREILGC